MRCSSCQKSRRANTSSASSGAMTRSICSSPSAICGSSASPRRTRTATAGQTGATLARVRRTLAATAARSDRAFAGTALYALADDSRAAAGDRAVLRSRTAALVRNGNANRAARISAIMLVGQREYRDVLPDVRRILDASVSDVPLVLAAIGTAGLLGTEPDIPRLRRLTRNLRLTSAVDTAIGRIETRMRLP